MFHNISCFPNKRCTCITRQNWIACSLRAWQIHNDPSLKTVLLVCSHTARKFRQDTLRKWPKSSCRCNGLIAMKTHHPQLQHLGPFLEHRWLLYKMSSAHRMSLTWFGDLGFEKFQNKHVANSAKRSQKKWFRRRLFPKWFLRCLWIWGRLP